MVNAVVGAPALAPLPCAPAAEDGWQWAGGGSQRVACSYYGLMHAMPTLSLHEWAVVEKCPRHPVV